VVESGRLPAYRGDTRTNRQVWLWPAPSSQIELQKQDQQLRSSAELLYQQSNFCVRTLSANEQYEQSAPVFAHRPVVSLLVSASHYPFRSRYASSDKEFRELELKAQVAPSQSQWPTDHLHWQYIGMAANEARSGWGKFLEMVDEIEADKRLSREGKAEERKKAAEKALLTFEGSRTLARAQESVGSVMKKWEAKVAEGIKRASDAHEAAIHTQIREKLAGIKDMKDRMVFLERNGGNPALADAVLSAPPFLSGLTEGELSFVRSKVEQRTLPPEVVETKVGLARAMREVEVGWERAKARIASGGGLKKARGSVSAAA
jgi:hypothetical protein